MSRQTWLAQNFSNANIRANRDVGSGHIVRSETTNSHNDHSVRQRTQGDHYSGLVNQGDQFSGEFNGSVLGGRDNNNEVNNTSTAGIDAEFAELLEEKRRLLEDLEKKRQRKLLVEDLETLRAEVAALKAEHEAD